MDDKRERERERERGREGGREGRRNKVSAHFRCFSDSIAK
jgi:hypothetical protein